MGPRPRRLLRMRLKGRTHFKRAWPGGWADTISSACPAQSCFNGATAQAPAPHAPKGENTLQEGLARRLGRHNKLCVPRAELLQWGHGPKAVETSAGTGNAAFYVVLQWGHGPKAVETCPYHPRSQRARVASMGPRPEGRGDCASRGAYT